ncbi:hypothetical protein Goklo_025300, partial [Gossypium klotzschianum]|nr:hypothetical protein [Gossypium klotzschianum]
FKLVVAEKTGYIIEATPVFTLPPEAQAPTPRRRYNKKYCHKERNITLRSLLEVKRYETDDVLPVHRKKKKESNNQSESPTPLLLLTYGETGKQNEELEASTIERTNSENMHMSDLTISASTTPKDIPINDETAPIDVPIIDEAALIDVPITYVENFSGLAR